MTFRRWIQIGSWFLLGPVIGLLQTGPSFLPGPLDRDSLRTLLEIAIIYGTAWLTSALVLSDILFIRRALEASGLGRYLLVIAVVALFSGFVFEGMAVMIGHPVTAGAILLVGYFFRKGRSGTQSQRAAAR